MTVTVDGAVVAAYGSAVTSDWRTTGVCFDAVSVEVWGGVEVPGDVLGADHHQPGPGEAPVRWRERLPGEHQLALQQVHRAQHGQRLDERNKLDWKIFISLR